MNQLKSTGSCPNLGTTIPTRLSCLSPSLSLAHTTPVTRFLSPFSLSLLVRYSLFPSFSLLKKGKATSSSSLDLKKEKKEMKRKRGKKKVREIFVPYKQILLLLSFSILLPRSLSLSSLNTSPPVLLPTFLALILFLAS